MVYILLNILIFAFLIYFTRLIDVKVKTDSREVSSFAVSILYLLVESACFIITLFFKNIWYDSFSTQIMKFAFCFDGIFFVNISFSFIRIGSKKKRGITRFFSVILSILAVVLVYSQFSSIDVSYDKGIIIVSKFLFPENARVYFPWTWYDLFTFVYRFTIPVLCYVYLVVMQEYSASQLEKYQTLVIGESIVLMWLVSTSITFISKYAPVFSLLYMFSYLFLVVVIYSGFTKTTVPSGKGVLVSIIKVLISYLIPALLLGFIVTKLQPAEGTFDARFISLFILAGTAFVVISMWLLDLLSSSSKIYTADYESSLEKDLASIDYSTGEMDAVTAKMYENFRKNVEASSMNVFIIGSHNDLEVAYTSNNLDVKIPLSNPIFDTLLNVNKSVVVWSEIEKEHDVASIQQELTDFFELTKSDALFILNEGHNIFGLITLGKKTSGDHYKEYDYNVFVKLYSYFFVFGYYMRNISNKEIIGVVNREIKMSSQIITSIQENIDHIKNQKIDVGYLMVPSHNIGGEFIDLIRLTDNRHLFVVGDLSGKGIAASMNMVILKSIIRTYLTETHDFKQLVVKTNSFIRESLRKGTIFAGLFALIDFETDTLYYINCGIPALMMYTQVYNNVIEIQGSGHVLGFVKDISPFISVKTTKLNRGDIIFACTDGMIQSHSLRGEQFGKERVQQALLDNSTYPAQRMAQFTFDGLLKFMSKEMEDDVSLLVLKYESSLQYQDTEEKAEPPVEGSIDIPEDATPPEEPVVEDASDEESKAFVEETEVTPVATETLASELGFSEPDDAEAMAAIAAAQEEMSETKKEIEEAESEIGDVSEEVPAPEEEDTPIKASDDSLPEDMPDLSDLDALMKEAGL